MTRFPLVLLASALLPVGGAAQSAHWGVGAGVAVPGRSLDFSGERGHTLRGQVGFEFLTLGVVLQGGWTRLPASPVAAAVTEGERRFQHLGVGLRVRFGPLWLGATGARFFGDADEAPAVLPEVGIGWGPFEVVADGRIHGDDRWSALRAVLRF